MDNDIQGGDIVQEGCDKILIDQDFDVIVDRLFFINSRYIKFWISNQNFIREYRNGYRNGEQDGICLFCDTAEEVFSLMQDVESKGMKTNFDFNTAVQSIKQMKFKINSGYDDRYYDPKLRFVFRRVSAPYHSIRYWLMVPEFIDEIHKLIPTDIRIDDKSIYPIMAKIYQSKMKLRDAHTNDGSQVQFDFKVARSAIKSIEKKLSIPRDESALRDISLIESNAESDSVSKYTGNGAVRDT